MLNKQIDLILLKKKDICDFNERIVFKRNKKELNILAEIIDVYEKIKREINVYEFVPQDYMERATANMTILKELRDREKQIENDIKINNNPEKYEDELMQMKIKAEEIKSFFSDSNLVQKRMNIGNNSLKEINQQEKYINDKIDELIQQMAKTRMYWKWREKVLL